MAENVEIARGVVRIDTDTSGVAPALEQVRVEVDKTTEKTREAEVQAEKTGKTFTPSFHGALAPVRAFRGALLGVVGTIGAALAAGVALGRGLLSLGEAFKSGSEKARDFKNSLDLSDVGGSIDQLQERMQTLAGELNTAQRGGAAATLVLFGKTPAQIRSEYDQLNELLEGLLKAQNAAKQRAREEDAAKALADAARAEAEVQDAITAIRDRARQRELDQETDRYKVAEGQAQAAIDAVRRELEKATDDRIRYELAREAESIKAAYEMRVAAMRREDAEAERQRQAESARSIEAAQATAQASARASAEAFARVESDLRARLNNIGIERLAGSIETLIQRLGVLSEANRNGTRRL